MEVEIIHIQAHQHTQLQNHENIKIDCKFIPFFNLILNLEKKLFIKLHFRIINNFIMLVQSVINVNPT